MNESVKYNPNLQSMLRNEVQEILLKVALILVDFSLLPYLPSEHIGILQVEVIATKLLVASKLLSK